MNTSILTTEPEPSATGGEAAVYSDEEIERMPTEDLWEAYRQTKSVELKWALVLRYQDLVKNTALQVRGIYSSFAQVDDIVSEGIFTLLNAVDKFDPSKGARFETYISKRIRGMVIDLARRQDWLPRNVRKRAKEINQTIATLANDLGRFPTDTEIAKALEISTEKYQRDLANIALSNVLSLDALINAKDRENYQFEVPSGDLYGQPESALQDAELQQVLAKGIEKLRKNEQIVLSLYYEKNLHMKEISQVLNVSEPRVSQIHAHALQKLRQYMDAYLNGKPLKMKRRRKE